MPNALHAIPGRSRARFTRRAATTSVVVASLVIAEPGAAQQRARVAPAIESRVVPVLTMGGMRFRDLDRDGRVSPFEDWRLSPERRAADLVARMTLEEKGGAVVHGTAPAGDGPMSSGPTYDTTRATAQVLDRHVTSVITRLAIPPADFATQSNVLQAIAERGRLGIPVTVSTDPRNHFQSIQGASVETNGFSQWPEFLGFGALGDTAVVRRFAAIVRDEYRAVGIHMALSPQADLATEPRWSRINGTFGEDPRRVAPLVRAFVEGMQGGARGLTRSGVATVVKHWVGYGAAVDGWDGHNYYGRFSAFPGGRFDDHVAAFLGAFDVGVSAVMPTYNILKDLSIDGEPVEQVGAGFNAQLLQRLLREKHKFRGAVISDWAITQDCNAACRTGTPPQKPWDIAMPWGVESLSKAERFAKGMNAGVDQFGGVDDGAPLVEAVRNGLVTQARLDTAVMRVMRLKFELGLFENPYVDARRAARVVGNAESQRLATRTQARALVVLENSLGGASMVRPKARVYLRGVAPASATARGLAVASDPADADVAIVRIAAPYRSEHRAFFFGSFQHEGRLDFAPGDSVIVALSAVAAKVPTIVVVYLDRPAILTQVKPSAKAILGDFGSSDDALMDVLLGRVRAVGRLPFELPSSMDAVAAQASDAPADSRSPLYPIGYRAPARR